MNLTREQACVVKKMVKEKLHSCLEEHFADVVAALINNAVDSMVDDSNPEFKEGEWYWDIVNNIPVQIAHRVTDSKYNVLGKDGVLCGTEVKRLRPLCESDWMRKICGDEMYAYYTSYDMVRLVVGHNGIIDYHEFGREVGEEICKKLGIPIMPHKVAKTRAPF